jgi:hypothetical protein
MLYNFQYCLPSSGKLRSRCLVSPMKHKTNTHSCWLSPLPWSLLPRACRPASLQAHGRATCSFWLLIFSFTDCCCSEAPPLVVVGAGVLLPPLVDDRGWKIQCKHMIDGNHHIRTVGTSKMSRPPWDHNSVCHEASLVASSSSKGCQSAFRKALGGYRDPKH